VVLDSSMTFVVTINRDSCEKTMEVMVIVPPMINLEIVGDTFVCDSTPVLLVAIADQPVTFEWSEEPGFDVIFSMEDSINVVPGRPTTYYVRATDTLGCSKVDSITVGNYMPGLQVSNDTMICLGDEIMLSATSIFPNDILIFNWEPDSAIITGDSTGFIVINPTVNTIFTVTATNQYGCSKTDSIEVIVKDIADLFTISADPDTLIGGVIDSTQLMVTDLPGYTYEWSPEEFILGSNLIPDPIGVPGSSRVYAVKITDTMGCMTVLEIPVVVLMVPCEEFVFVPNAFTPNDDGLNDVLYAKTLETTNFYFAVYNRWGELVFETNDPSIGWDGTYEGTRVKEDVYGYYVRYNCEGEDQFLKGNVSVLR
ncbi:MAG: gliding motility-associated C-terminal domain-containing protein, partial [Saprospiraceae bacterium]|nr:gliding motility-associated C-terminal domain-containing protein [Saprospiraceae bacterium]